MGAAPRRIDGGVVGDAGVVVAGCNALTTGAAGIGGRADVSGEAGGVSWRRLGRRDFAAAGRMRR